jgi:hypothetical protein
MPLGLTRLLCYITPRSDAHGFRRLLLRALSTFRARYWTAEGAMLLEADVRRGYRCLCPPGTLGTGLKCPREWSPIACVPICLALISLFHF